MTKHQWISTNGDMADSASWSSGEAPATKAIGTLTFTVLPAINDTVQIDGKTYRFVDSLTATNDVLRKTFFTDSRNNLVAAITLGGADNNVENSTVVHTTVTAVAESTDKLNATAIKYGTAGNSLSTTVPIGTGCSWGAATLSGATQWAITDIIVVPPNATQNFLTNLDWVANCDPVLEVRNFNVDITNINFGVPGNTLRLNVGTSTGLGGFNYLGVGLMYANFNRLVNMYVNSSTSETVLVLSGAGTVGLKFCIVNAGHVQITANTTIDYLTTGSEAYTTGSEANLEIQGVSDAGFNFVCAMRGFIRNERATSEGDFDKVIIGPEGRLVQVGIVHSGGFGEFILNLGGQFSYESVSDPAAFLAPLRLFDGINRFDLTAWPTIGVNRLFTGVNASVFRGGADFNFNLAPIDVDLADDFPF